ncbi:MAG: hypothetical protein ACJ73S_15800 [Mycobacteriales bacterium]
MAMGNLEPVADVSAADWIAERLAGPVGTVSSVVPGGYPAYARVLHPVEFDDDSGRAPLTWARVCELTGGVPHALMQWHAIVRPAARSRSVVAWDDGDVRVGSLAPDALAALLDVLGPFTGEQDCYHALWEGWGWVDGGGVTVVAFTDDGTAVPAPPVEPGVPPEVWALPRLRLPDRDHLLFRGPLRAALDMGWHASPLGFEPQSPNLFWPADRAWCVGTEIDFDSTLVGGPVELVDAVLAAPGLEAWPVDPGDSLTADADRINT